MTTPTLKPPKLFVVISDHAILRYLERQLGIDVDHYRREILALVYGPALAGATAFSHGDVTFTFLRQSTGYVHVTTAKTRHRKISKRGAKP